MTPRTARRHRCRSRWRHPSSISRAWWSWLCPSPCGSSSSCAFASGHCGPMTAREPGTRRTKPRTRRAPRHGLQVECSNATNQPLLFLTPTGLAVGLALKELRFAVLPAIRPGDRIWPLWVPRSLRLGASETRLGSSFGRAAYTNCKIDATGGVMESGAGPRGGGARRGPRAGLPAGGRGAARPAGAPGSRGPAPGSRRTRRGGGPPGPRGPRPRAPVRRTLRETSQTPSPPGSKADFSG